MNIYEMYKVNNFKFGYFIVRNTWENMVAKVVKIDKTVEGYKITGNPPYYGNPEVTAEFYIIPSVAFMGFVEMTYEEIKERCNNENLLSVGLISGPGNYSYDLII